MLASSYSFVSPSCCELMGTGYATVRRHIECERLWSSLQIAPGQTALCAAACGSAFFVHHNVVVILETEPTYHLQTHQCQVLGRWPLQCVAQQILWYVSCKLMKLEESYISTYLQTQTSYWPACVHDNIAHITIAAVASFLNMVVLADQT